MSCHLLFRLRQDAFLAMHYRQKSEYHLTTSTKVHSSSPSYAGYRYGLPLTPEFLELQEYLDLLNQYFNPLEDPIGYEDLQIAE